MNFLSNFFGRRRKKSVDEQVSTEHVNINLDGEQELQDGVDQNSESESVHYHQHHECETFPHEQLKECKLAWGNASNVAEFGVSNKRKSHKFIPDCGLPQFYCDILNDIDPFQECRDFCAMSNIDFFLDKKDKDIENLKEQIAKLKSDNLHLKRECDNLIKISENYKKTSS